jgi:hypothetical protein
MHHIEATRLPLLLAQHRINLLNDAPPQPLPTARPALPHWTTAHHPALANESAHDFLVLGIRPELLSGH